MTLFPVKERLPIMMDISKHGKKGKKTFMSIRPENQELKRKAKRKV